VCTPASCCVPYRVLVATQGSVVCTHMSGLRCTTCVCVSIVVIAHWHACAVSMCLTMSLMCVSVYVRGCVFVYVCACLFMCMTFALHSPLPGCCVRIGALPCILCLVRRPVRHNPAWLPRCDHLLQPGHLPHRLHGCYVRDSDHASSEPRCLCVCPSRCALLGRDTGTQRRPPAQAPSPSPQLSGLEGMRACGHVGMGP
jgi:hypothetical protein